MIGNPHFDPFWMAFSPLTWWAILQPSQAAGLRSADVTIYEAMLVAAMEEGMWWVGEHVVLGWWKWGFIEDL